MNFDAQPPAPQQPKYNPEQLQRYLQETDGAISTSIQVLLRGMEVSANPETYAPWSRAEVQKALSSILTLTESKAKYYEGAGKTKEAEEVRQKVGQLKQTFSEIDGVEEIPAGFLERVKLEVEA